MTLPASGTISFSDIQTELGGSNPISMSEYYGVSSLPASGTISADDFHGISGAITLSSVTATNISVHDDDTASSAIVQGTSTATTIPTNDGSVSYSWTKISGDTISNSGSGNQRTFSAGLNDGESVFATYRCTASNSNGSVFDNFTISLSYTDIGS